MDQFKDDIKVQKANDQLSNNVNLLSMIESRIMEIIQIEDECKRKLPKLNNQRLPRFMRRRAACHNPKRLPKHLRSAVRPVSRDTKKLLKYRRRLRFRKHKRLLKKHASNKLKNPYKCLLHKWFGKRFRMASDGTMEQVPLYNNTKNQRNLYRQTRYGCAYLSLAHLIAMQLTFKDRDTLVKGLAELNCLTRQEAGFTFQAKSLIGGRYECAIHIYQQSNDEYLCSALVGLELQEEKEGSQGRPPRLTLWVPRRSYQQVYTLIETISKQNPDEVCFHLKQIYPRDMVRTRLVGPEARSEAMKLAQNKENHEKALEDVDWRLNFPNLGASIGRYLVEDDADFVYYRTQPLTVDIIFKNKKGRLLWHQLIKNKAHLVGGYRDIDRLLVADCFKIQPDCFQND